MAIMDAHELTEHGEGGTITWWVDEREGFTTIWHVPPPEVGSWFVVVCEEWNENSPVRHIYSWSPAEHRA